MIKQEGLYQNKVNSSLVSTCNFEMNYYSSAFHWELVLIGISPIKIVHGKGEAMWMSVSRSLPCKQSLLGDSAHRLAAHIPDVGFLCLHDE